MRSIVVDTSALLATFEEGRADDMERLHARSHLLAPSLLAYELGNIVHRKRPQAFGRNARERRELVETLLDDIELVEPEAAMLRAAGDAVEKEGLTFYDASFLALAQIRDAVVLTEDGPLAKVASKVLGKARVMRLG